RVRMVERLADLARKSYRLVDGQTAFAREPGPQRLALDERHHIPQQRAPAPTSRVEQRKDVGVLEQSSDADLLEETFGAHGRRDFVAHHFDRNGTIVSDVARAVDGGHAAPRDLTL